MIRRMYVDDNEVVVEVTHGLGDWWICARGRHRVKSKALPPRKTWQECQRDLDAYAASKNWQPINTDPIGPNGPPFPE